jgi:four helix bundle protein
MLRIYPIVLEVLKRLQPVVRQLERRDRDLARQLRRCSTSIALNLAEGMYSRGRNRAARYHSALGSARETMACLEVASACGHVVGQPLPDAELSRIVGTLVKLVE